MATKSVVEVLREARALIADPAHWARGTWGHGKKCCAAGAIIVASGERYPNNLPNHDGARAIDSLCDTLGLSRSDWALSRWNDDPDRTHSEVLAAWFDRAIEANA